MKQATEKNTWRTAVSFRLIYAVLVYLLAFYVSMTPVALIAGWWAKSMLTPADWPEYTPHLILICLLWVLFGSNKVICVAGFFIAIATFCIGQMLSHWSLFTDNNWRYWLAAFCVDLAEPALAIYLLVAANRLAPLVLPGWKTTYAR